MAEAAYLDPAGADGSTSSVEEESVPEQVRGGEGRGVNRSLFPVSSVRPCKPRMNNPRRDRPTASYRCRGSTRNRKSRATSSPHGHIKGRILRDRRRRQSSSSSSSDANFGRSDGRRRQCADREDWHRIDLGLTPFARQPSARATEAPFKFQMDPEPRSPKQSKMR